MTEIMAPGICPEQASANPAFKVGDMVTAEGEKRVKTQHQKGTSVSSLFTLLSGLDILKSSWTNFIHFRQHMHRSSNGGKVVKGPLLITQGTSNPPLGFTLKDRRAVSLRLDTALFAAWCHSRLFLSSLPAPVNGLDWRQICWADVQVYLPYERNG